jgi:hypothetical protein
LKIYYQYVPPAFAWYDVPTGGSSLYSLSPFNPLAYTNAVVNNSNVPGNYTFYAACLGLTNCRVPVKLKINPTPAACQDTILYCEYAIGANNAIFNLCTADTLQTSCNNLAASVKYFGDQALLSPLPCIDTSSTNIIYSKVTYDSSGCYSSDTVFLQVSTIPQFTQPIYTGFACAPSSIDISSLIGLFAFTPIDTFYYSNTTPSYTVSYSGNPHAISNVDTLYMIAKTSDGAGCADSAVAYINVLAATNNIVNQSAGNYSISGTVPCGNITLTNGSSQTLYTTSDCRRIATVTDNPIDFINLGSTSICEEIDGVPGFWNTQPYVNRHYEITPTNNGKATVCLYFLDDDFQTYNSAAFPAWPSMIADMTDPNMNLCITQIHNGPLGAPGSTAISIPHTVISTSYDPSTTVWTVCFPVDSFSSFYCHTCNPLNTPLPVTLTTFTGRRVDGTSELHWNTSSELNNSHFIVERSKDAKSFHALSPKIQSKAPGGNSSVNLDYAYTDASPFEGHNYYRLQQVDIDGHVSYSSTVDVYFGNETLVSLYPNPVNSELNVDINTPKETNAIVRILDATGRTVRTVEMLLQVGSNSSKVDMHDLSDGIYLISVTNSKGLNYTQVIRKK